MKSKTQGPLNGVTVIDLGQIYNGPYCTFLMAMAGARVIKVEPKGGENLRRRAKVGGAAVPFAMLNSNKECITLDLKSARGKELFRAMVAKADVVIENFSQGAMERLSLGFDASADEPLNALSVTADGFARAGAAIGGLGLPTVLVQEGGYNVDVIGGLLKRFLTGFEDV